MAMVEHISNINIITEDEIEDELNNSFTENSHNINKNQLNTIQSLFLDFDKYPYKQSLIKPEIECFYSQINNCSIKERLVLETLLKINHSCTNIKKQKVLTYEDIFQSNGESNIEIDNIFNLEKKIFDGVDRVSHKTLHKDIVVEGKNVKICSIYPDINKMEFKESENIDYTNTDKLINSMAKKEKDNNFEFIAIKAIIITFINLTGELINNYFIKSTEINIMEEDYYLNEDYDSDENNIIIFKPNLFETIFNDYVFTSNRCSYLENYFIESFNNFRAKYQMSFALRDLFTDIFWNCIFHNKILSNKFISIYIGNDSSSKNIRVTLSKIIKIISDISLPLKSKVLQLLSMTNIENKNDIDLMTSIVNQKSINHDLIKNENIISQVNNKMAINEEYIKSNDNNENKEKNSNTNNIKNNSIKKNNNDNKNDKNDNNDDNENKNNELNENDLEHKTADEVYNYINDNKEVKSKKKKRNKKKKGKKMENQMKNYNEENDTNEEDPLVKQFKIDLEQKTISAKNINKVKPVLSDKWIKMISDL